MRFVSVFAATLLFATAAFAHTGGHGAAGTSGLGYGFLHPFGGLDHVLAMVGVGLFASFLGARALWLVPAAFVAMMAVGGVLGFAGLGIPFVEAGIALSIVVIGGALALGRSLPVAAAMALVGFFAVFHGFAHGAEMPATASGLAYGLGFLVATALLHGAGLALGFGLDKTAKQAARRFARLGGGVVSLCGLAILAGVL
ncbi:MAG: HupE/UreJ family protein [Kiloniellaceae bacterium]